MSTSLQYNFPYIDADLIIREAYERCGIPNTQIANLDYESARRSFNFMLQQWPNEGFNIFTYDQGIIQIVPNQSLYALPLNTSKILDIRLTNSNRILGGTASSSAGGVAANCFTTTATGACTQTSINGNISYLFTTTIGAQAILYVGILSYTTNVYQISIDCSFSTAPADDDWINVLNTPQINYYTGVYQWYSLPFTYTALNWRIRETGGGTLNIAQIYFSIPYQSQPALQEGVDLYFQQVTNNNQGASSNYWVNRIRTPVLNLYPWPDNTWQLVVYNRIRYIQDIGDFFNNIDVPAKFIEPAAAGLAARLAQKFAPERYADLKQTADEMYIKAGREDTQNVPLQITQGNAR